MWNFQMDQTTLSYQIILWHLRKCRLYPDMDSCVRVLTFSVSQKKMHIEKPSLYMISQTIGTMLFEKIPVRELFNKPNLNISSDDGQLDLFQYFQS